MKRINEKYQDGAESFLLDFFSNGPESKKRSEINNLLSSNSNWAINYHLSEQRKQLVDWISFSGKEEILEIGAGCGALTGLYCDVAKYVVASELEEERAEVIRRRYSDKKNLSVITSNVVDLVEKQFDVVSVVGVLEYSGKFIKDNNPYLSFLKKIRRLVKKNGLLILAIENKIGLKYFAGCMEDHTGKPFDSINNYPNQDGVKTFSKAGLNKLLQVAGFANNEYYYPYPDYKMPTTVISDEYFKLNKILGPASFFNSNEYTQHKIVQIDETQMGVELHENGILENFTNSFLVIAKP